MSPKKPAKSSVRAHPCGTEIPIGDGVTAIIEAVCIRGSTITYSLEWFEGASYRTSWVTAGMVQRLLSGGHGRKMGLSIMPMENPPK